MNLEKILAAMMVAILFAIIIFLAMFNIYTPSESQGFTELYLTGNHPSDVTAGSSYDFSFGIHNLENKKVVYTYAVLSHSEAIGQGYITLDHDETSIITQRFSVDNETTDNETIISVSLVNKDQEVHFRIYPK